MEHTHEEKLFFEDREWALDHYSELIGKYPDLWVAIVDKKVIAATEDGSCIEIAKEKTGRKKIYHLFACDATTIY